MAMLAVWLRGGWPSIEQRKLDVASVAERHAIVAMITKTTEDLTAEDPRRRSGFMRLPAYPCSERVRGCCQGVRVCVPGCAIQLPAYTFGDVFLSSPG